MNLQEMQKQIAKNAEYKPHIEHEFCLLFEEIGEAFEAYRKQKDDLGKELATSAMLLFGLAEALDISLQKEIEKILKKDEKKKQKDQTKKETDAE